MTEPGTEARERILHALQKCGVQHLEGVVCNNCVDLCARVLAQAEQERDDLRLNFSLARWNELEASLAAMRRALEPFAYPSEADGTFLVTGRDVNRAREALASPAGAELAEAVRRLVDVAQQVYESDSPPQRVWNEFGKALLAPALQGFR